MTLARYRAALEEIAGGCSDAVGVAREALRPRGPMLPDPNSKRQTRMREKEERRHNRHMARENRISRVFFGFVEGKTQAEIARELGCHATTVNSDVETIRNRIRWMIEDIDDAEA